MLELFQARYHELCRLLARRLGDPTLAAESAHDAYLRLVTVERGRVAVTVAANCATDRARRLTREQHMFRHDAALEQRPDQAPLPERVAAGRQEVVLLQAALAEVAPKPRTALLLSRVEGWSHARIAGHLQVSERMVAKYIASGLQQLRQRLREDGPDGG